MYEEKIAKCGRFIARVIIIIVCFSMYLWGNDFIEAKIHSSDVYASIHKAIKEENTNIANTKTNNNISANVDKQVANIKQQQEVEKKRQDIKIQQEIDKNKQNLQNKKEENIKKQSIKNLENAQKVFHSYHEALEDHDWDKAYDLMTPNRRKGMGDKKDFSEGYKHTIASKVTDMKLLYTGIDEMAFKYSLEAKDKLPNKRVKIQNFEGTVHMFYINGHWKVGYTESKKINEYTEKASFFSIDFFGD